MHVRWTYMQHQKLLMSKDLNARYILSTNSAGCVCILENVHISAAHNSNLLKLRSTFEHIFGYIIMSTTSKCWSTSYISYSLSPQAIFRCYMRYNRIYVTVQIGLIPRTCENILEGPLWKKWYKHGNTWRTIRSLECPNLKRQWSRMPLLFAAEEQVRFDTFQTPNWHFQLLCAVYVGSQSTLKWFPDGFIFSIEQNLLDLILANSLQTNSLKS